MARFSEAGHVPGRETVKTLKSGPLRAFRMSGPLKRRFSGARSAAGRGKGRSADRRGTACAQLSVKGLAQGEQALFRRLHPNMQKERTKEKMKMIMIMRMRMKDRGTYRGAIRATIRFARGCEIYIYIYLFFLRRFGMRPEPVLRRRAREQRKTGVAQNCTTPDLWMVAYKGALMRRWWKWSEWSLPARPAGQPRCPGR